MNTYYSISVRWLDEDSPWVRTTIFETLEPAIAEIRKLDKSENNIKIELCKYELTKEELRELDEGFC